MQILMKEKAIIKILTNMLGDIVRLRSQKKEKIKNSREKEG